MVTLGEIAKTIKEKGKYWIAFTGDSITSCEWAHPNWREIVEYVLKDKLNYDWGLKTFNFAYDGSTSEDLLDRVGELKLLNPNMVIMLTGANDPFRNPEIPPDIFKSNVSVIKKIIDDLGSQFVLSSDNYPNNEWAAEKCLPYLDKLQEVDEKFINLFEVSKSFPMDRIYTFVSEMDIPEEHVKNGENDFWHPNQLGNAYVAKVMLKEIFGIEFDPEKFWKETLAGKKLPRY